MISINSIISAIGNNNSIYPLLVRDCGIEVPTKVYKTYKQNSDDKEIAYLATRERFIDEYATSMVWLGGIPLIDKICDKIITKKGLSPEVNIKLLQAEDKLNEIDKQISSLKGSEVPTELAEKRNKIYLQSLSGNIEKFASIEGAEKAVEELKKVKLNQKLYKNLQAGKFFAEMAIPIALMGFIIPKSVYALTAVTRKKIDRLKAEKAQNKKVAFAGMDEFRNKSQNIAFGNNIATSLCNFSTVQKMAITDGGYAVGRVSTARKKRGAIDIAFRMGGMLYLNFVAPKQIEYILSAVSKKMFNLDVNLDPIILGDKEFIKQINNNTLKLPKSNKIEDMLNFIDNKENCETLFVKFAKKLDKIKTFENGVRDPRAYVDEQKLGELRDNMENFLNDSKKIREKALTKMKNIQLSADKIEEAVFKYVKKFAMKARVAKTCNIVSNVALSSYLLACVLPDAQYLIREKDRGMKRKTDLL